MSTSDKTLNLGLPIALPSDRVDWYDVNKGFQLIDEAYGRIDQGNPQIQQDVLKLQQDMAVAQTDIAAATQLATAAQSSASGANSTANTALNTSQTANQKASAAQSTANSALENAQTANQNSTLALNNAATANQNANTKLDKGTELNVHLIKPPSYVTDYHQTINFLSTNIIDAFISLYISSSATITEISRVSGATFLGSTEHSRLLTLAEGWTLNGGWAKYPLQAWTETVWTSTTTHEQLGMTVELGSFTRTGASVPSVGFWLVGRGANSQLVINHTIPISLHLQFIFP